MLPDPVAGTSLSCDQPDPAHSCTTGFQPHPLHTVIAERLPPRLSPLCLCIIHYFSLIGPGIHQQSWAFQMLRSLLPSPPSSELGPLFSSYVFFLRLQMTLWSFKFCVYEKNNRKKGKGKCDAARRQQLATTKMPPPSPSTATLLRHLLLLFFFCYLVSLQGMHLFVLLLFCTGDFISLCLPPPVLSLSFCPVLPDASLLLSFCFPLLGGSWAKSS